MIYFFAIALMLSIHINLSSKVYNQPSVIVTTGSSSPYLFNLAIANGSCDVGIATIMLFLSSALLYQCRDREYQDLYHPGGPQYPKLVKSTLAVGAVLNFVRSLLNFAMNGITVGQLENRMDDLQQQIKQIKNNTAT